MSRVSKMPSTEFTVLEGELTIREIGGQVFLEAEGDCWYSCVTLTRDSIIGIHEWLACHRQAEGF